MQVNPQSLILAVDADHTLWTYPEDIDSDVVADQFNRFTRTAYEKAHARGVRHFVSTGNHIGALEPKLQFFGVHLFEGIFCKVGTELYRIKNGSPILDPEWQGLMQEFDYKRVLSLVKDFCARQEGVHYEPHKEVFNGPGKASGHLCFTPENWQTKQKQFDALSTYVTDNGIKNRILWSLIADKAELDHFNKDKYTSKGFAAERTVNLDCLSPYAGKGGPLKSISEWYPESSIVVAGDSGNDADSFSSSYAFDRILPRWNAKEELKQLAEELLSQGDHSVFVSSFPAGMAIVDWLVQHNIVSRAELV